MYEDMDSLERDIGLIVEAFRWTWAGDPEIVTDRHWQAYTRLNAHLGWDEE